jgi:dCMP deaminase
MSKYIKPMMATAILWSKMSYCKRRQVGAVIATPDNRIISIGYNGTLNYTNNVCEDENNNTLMEVQHAERNALDVCTKNGISTKGCDLYITTSPCIECAKSIYSTGIRTVYYKDKYHNTDGIDLLQRVGVEVIQVEM